MASEPASVPSVAGELRPHSPPSTRASVSPATPAISSAAPNASGRGTGWPGTAGSRRQPTYSAAQPDGSVDDEDPALVGRDQQAADDGPEGRGQAPERRPRANRGLPTLVWRSGEDEPQARRGGQRGAPRLKDAEDDQRGHSPRRRARRRRHREDEHAEQEAQVS